MKGFDRFLLALLHTHTSGTLKDKRRRFVLGSKRTSRLGPDPDTTSWAMQLKHMQVRSGNQQCCWIGRLKGRTFKPKRQLKWADQGHSNNTRGWLQQRHTRGYIRVPLFHLGHRLARQTFKSSSFDSMWWQRRSQLYTTQQGST